jgi:glycosyltransferase involved in cell wall biosynthesis
MVVYYLKVTSFKIVADTIARVVKDINIFVGNPIPFAIAWMPINKWYFIVEGKPRLYNAFSEVYTCSNSSKRYLEQAGYKVKKVIPHSVPYDMYEREFTIRRRNSPIKFLYIAGYSKRKYPPQHTVFDALKDKNIEIEIHTTPNNPYLSYYSKYNFVKVYTDAYQLSREQIIRLYNSCDYYLNLSDAEGFGLTVLEALACGKPVIHANFEPLTEITTNKCSIRFDTVSHDIELYSFYEINHNIYSPISLINAINKAIKISESEYIEMCYNALDRAKEFPPSVYEQFS